MTCKQCKTKPVWKFTNKVQLCKKCFCDYFERKIFRTIRKHDMLPKDKEIRIKKSSGLNTMVLVFVLQKKFQVKFTGKPNFSCENLSDVSEMVFSNVLKGKFLGAKPKQGSLSLPLYYLSDKEIELYAKIKKISGKKSVRDKKVQTLFSRFFKKNPDLEHNIVNAFSQI